MGIRTACFAVAGLFAISTQWTAVAWVCVAAAVLLPYPAVVFANVTDRRVQHMDLVTPTRAIGPSQASTRQLL